MPILQERDFDNMASKVVDRFMQGDKLADVAAMEAQQEQLNPDQIERLVHAANTMAFLRLMEQQKAQGIPDMTGEFDPIDSRQIMQHLVNSAPGPEEEGLEGMPHGMGEEPGMEHEGMPHAEPDGDECELPDEMSSPMGEMPPMDDDNDGPFPRGAKDTEKAKKKPPAGPPKKDEAKEAAFRANRLRKLADILDDQYQQAEWAFEDIFTKLSSCLRKAYGAPSPGEFEKDALSLHNSEIGVVVLNMVKAGQNLPVITQDTAMTKCAALEDRHIVEDTEANKLFATLVKIATEATKLKQGAEYARTKCS